MRKPIRNKKIKNTTEDSKDADISNVSGSCFWGHKWTKWEQYVQNVRFKWGNGVENRQVRHCMRCNKAQDTIY